MTWHHFNCTMFFSSNKNGKLPKFADKWSTITTKIGGINRDEVIWRFASLSLSSSQQEHLHCMPANKNTCIILHTHQPMRAPVLHISQQEHLYYMPTNDNTCIIFLHTHQPMTALVLQISQWQHLYYITYTSANENTWITHRLIKTPVLHINQWQHQNYTLANENTMIDLDIQTWC